MRETIPGKMLGVSEKGRIKLLKSVANSEDEGGILLAIQGLIISGAKVPIRSESKYLNGRVLALTDSDTRIQLAFSKNVDEKRSWKYVFVETFRDWVDEYLANIETSE